jgi:hypothetical protein
MNWEALAAIAELLGAIGVLASLIYLGLQIRQNTTWLRQQAFQLSTNEIRLWALQFSGSRGNAELFLKGQSDFGSLDPTERFRFTMMIFEICSVWATYQEHSSDDLLGLHESAESIIGTWIEQGWFTGWWELNSYMFSPGFKSFIGDLLQRHPPDV